MLRCPQSVLAFLLVPSALDDLYLGPEDLFTTIVTLHDPKVPACILHVHLDGVRARMQKSYMLRVLGPRNTPAAQFNIGLTAYAAASCVNDNPSKTPTRTRKISGRLHLT